MCFKDFKNSQLRLPFLLALFISWHYSNLVAFSQESAVAWSLLSAGQLSLSFLDLEKPWYRVEIAPARTFPSCAKCILLLSWYVAKAWIKKIMEWLLKSPYLLGFLILTVVSLDLYLKGKLGEKFLSAQSFYSTLTKRSFKSLGTLWTEWYFCCYQFLCKSHIKNFRFHAVLRNIWIKQIKQI